VVTFAVCIVTTVIYAGVWVSTVALSVREAPLAQEVVE